MKFKLTALLIILLTFTLHSQSTDEDWTSFSDKNYSIEYPKDWTLDNSGQMGASFFLFSPLASEDDQFRENVNLLIQDLNGLNVDLDQYVEISEKQVSTLITDSEIILSERNSKDILQFHKIIYTGKQGVFDLTYEQYYWVVNEQAFVLSLTCKKSEFENFKMVGEKILDSFKLFEN